MNNILKRTLQGIVAATIISGTYFGRNGDLPPFYSHKTSDSYGINVAVYTKIDSGASITGANVSIRTTNYGKINGANVTIGMINYGQINGVSVAVVSARTLKDKNFDASSQINGLELGIANLDRLYTLNHDKIPDAISNISGVSIGLVNFHNELNGVQIGVYNSNKKNSGVLLNIDYTKNSKRGQ